MGSRILGTLISVPAVLGAIAIFLLIAGLRVHHDYAAIANCSVNGPQESSACQQAIRHFNSVGDTSDPTSSGGRRRSETCRC